jgi:3-dehydroquinate dehydratase-2
MKIMVINGPNINMLGKREPEVYGSDSLDDVMQHTEEKIKKMGLKVSLEWYQSNIEGEIVDKIQALFESDFKALVINPAAYTHTSVAIHDALKTLKIPIVEVHLSNTHAREEFRNTKLTSKAATIIMEGLGKDAYYMGIISQLLK